MDPLPDPAELTWLFESEPEYPYVDDEGNAGYELGWERTWPYTRVIFRLARGSRAVEFDVEPGYEQVRLKISDGGSDVVDLLLRQVMGLAIDKAKGRELLRLDFGSNVDARSLWLQVKPEISLGWDVGHV